MRFTAKYKIKCENENTGRYNDERCNITRRKQFLYLFARNVVKGTLRAGDEILAINGSSLDGLTHAKALQMFKNAKAGNLILHVTRRDPTHKRLSHKPCSLK